MSAVTIGEMSHRFMLQAPMRTADGGGGGDIAWALVAEVWGALRPASGSEIVDADGVRGRLSHEIWIRPREDVDRTHRFMLGTRVFDVRAVIAVPGRSRFLKCLVEERLP